MTCEAILMLLSSRLVEFHLAEFNVARLRSPLDEPGSAEFVATLDAVNLIAEVSDGFVWRMKDESGRPSSYVVAYDDPHVIVNLTVWVSVESLRHFTYRSGHGAYYRRRREWFQPSSEITTVCWWIPAGELPSLDDAIARLHGLQTRGPSDAGFPLNDPRPQPTRV